MKFGFRTPSLEKMVKARTTGKIKRKVKKAINPLYGKKGMGLLTDPKKAVYNKIYSKTTVSVTDTITAPLKPTSAKKTTSSKRAKQTPNVTAQADTRAAKLPQEPTQTGDTCAVCGRTVGVNNNHLCEKCQAVYFPKFKKDVDSMNKHHATMKLSRFPKEVLSCAKKVYAIYSHIEADYLAKGIDPLIDLQQYRAYTLALANDCLIKLGAISPEKPLKNI